MHIKRPSKATPQTAERLRPGRKRAHFPFLAHSAPSELEPGLREREDTQGLETAEQRVAERTRDLLKAQEALRQSRKSGIIGQLTGGIAHDLNNLLTPIMANLELLQQTAIEEREQRLIDSALKSADSARTLVQRLLAFARRRALQPARVEMADLAEGMAELIARTLDPRIGIELDLDPDLAPAFADSNQLELAILNLSVNAQDAMPSGGTLTIKAANELAGPDHELHLEPGRYVRLSVVDTGIGMDAQTLERAIEPYFSTKGMGEGTGLGLSMVDGLTSLSGGAFRLSSRPGEGTAATLWLPVWTGPADADEPAPAPAFAAHPAGVALVVDDHDLVRASTADMLETLGYEVVQARSGEEAAEIISGGIKPDLLVTDHVMPGMSGADLARLANARSPGTRVLLVSGYSNPKGVPPGLPCLTKPFRRAELERHIAMLGERLRYETDSSCLAPSECP